MQITIAKYAGACFGVNRSIKMLENACKHYSKVVTLGELIHNPKTVAHLRDELGVEVVDSIDGAVKSGADAVVIRSHGVTADVDRQATESGICVIDATCPHVKHVQNTAKMLAQKYDCVIVVGKAGHPEVEGVLSYIEEEGSCGVCVNSAEEAKTALQKIADFTHEIGVVAQTTQSLSVFAEVTKILQDAQIKTEIINTICSATSKRQEAAFRSASDADVVVVLGGHNSSNTAHLAEICEQVCDRVFLIEDASEIKKSDFCNAERVVICAGASTPEVQIKNLSEYLSK